MLLFFDDEDENTPGYIITWKNRIVVIITEESVTLNTAVDQDSQLVRTSR